MHIKATGADGFALTPLGYWVATQEPKVAETVASGAAGQIGNDHGAGLQVLDLLTEALRVRWSKAVRSEPIESVQLKPQFASFLLFMLVGGAVGPSQPLRWSVSDTQSTETARDLLRDLCAELGWGLGLEYWSRNEELPNFVRRSQLRQFFGPSFRKVDDEKLDKNLLYFQNEPTLEELSRLLAPVVRCFGASEVVATVSKLEHRPWAKNPAFVPKLTSIRSLFGRHVCPPEYRHMLTAAAHTAAAELQKQAN
jgi:hypothetical protein